MKVIILAAGRGERLMPLTQNTPKPLIDMNNGNTLLEEQILSIQKSGVLDGVIVVTGYLADQIDAKIRVYRERGIPITTIYNPFWSVSNNLMSLWLARNTLNADDVMVTNGDNIFSSSIFLELSKQPEGIILSACRKTAYDSDDMRISIKNGEVRQVSKKIPESESHAESPGLTMIKGERARKQFSDQLESLARSKVGLNAFWLEIFNRLWDAGTPATPWYFDSKGNWQEVDFHVDVNLIRSLLDSRLNKYPQEHPI